MSLQQRVWDEERRQKIARQLCEEHTSNDINVPEAQGFVLLPRGMIDGFDRFQARVRKLFQDRLQKDGSITPMAADGGPASRQCPACNACLSCGPSPQRIECSS
jgi:hypothetical protein